MPGCEDVAIAFLGNPYIDFPSPCTVIPLPSNQIVFEDCSVVGTTKLSTFDEHFCVVCDVHSENARRGGIVTVKKHADRWSDCALTQLFPRRSVLSCSLASGDSGGPLIYKNKIIGIFTHTCCNPAIYYPDINFNGDVPLYRFVEPPLRRFLNALDCFIFQYFSVDWVGFFRERVQKFLGLIPQDSAAGIRFALISPSIYTWIAHTMKKHIG